MDKLGGLAKGGWHPGGDKPIKRETWKQDLKGIATRKKHDPYEEARNHQSRPLASLKDPDSFGPPPKHSAYHGAAASTSTPTAANPSSSAGGWGAAVPHSSQYYAQQKEQEPEPEEPPPPPEPYRVNTTGLRTDNLPKPPVRRVDADSPARSASPALPPRVPARQTQNQPTPPPAPRAMQRQPTPPPMLPPRQNEYPDEYTPAPPPPYTEATSQPPHDPAMINAGAAQRLGQAGVSVPAFGIGASGPSNATPPQSPARGPQLSELQQRFARMKTSADSEASPPPTPTSGAPFAHKKAPPPPPPKKAGLGSSTVAGPAPTAPPLPTASKPRPS